MPATVERSTVNCHRGHVNGPAFRDFVGGWWCRVGRLLLLNFSDFFQSITTILPNLLSRAICSAKFVQRSSLIKTLGGYREGAGLRHSPFRCAKGAEPTRRKNCPLAHPAIFLGTCTAPRRSRLFTPRFHTALFSSLDQNTVLESSGSSAVRSPWPGQFPNSG